MMTRCSFRPAALLLAVAVSHLCPCGPAAGQPGENAAVAAVVQAVDGALIQRAGPKAPWKAARPDDRLRAGTLVVALPKAKLVSANGKVELAMLADIGQRGPFPVLESAVALETAKGFDLAFTYDRGLIALINANKRGPAKVRIRLPGDVWELTLKEPGTKVIMELYARYPPGLELFHNKPGERPRVSEDPTTDLALLVLEGDALLNDGEQTHGLSAPPGFAKLLWDSLSGVHKVERLEKLPPAVRPPTVEELARLKEIRGRVSKIKTQPVPRAVAALVRSKDERERRLGIICLGATDDVSGLIDALTHPKDADGRETAVTALRHWMGRGRAQAQKLYEALAAREGTNPIEARAILQLLAGFSEEQRARPATYELLQVYLQHEDLSLRQLAWWHLRRLAAAAAKVDYDPAAPAAAREKAVRELRRLLPRDAVPEPPRAEGPRKK